MPLAEILSEVARGSLMLLVAVLAIYLSLRLLGKIAKFIIGAVVVALVIYFVFFATDIASVIKDAVLQQHVTFFKDPEEGQDMEVHFTF